MSPSTMHRGLYVLICCALFAVSAASQESRRAFATATFLDDWDRWSAEALNTLGAAKALNPTQLQSSKEASARIGRDIAALREKTPTATAVESRPAERVKRAVGDFEEQLGAYVSAKSEVLQKKRKRLALAELKNLRDAVAPRVDEIDDRQKKLDALTKKLEALRKTWVLALQAAELSDARRGRLLDLPESLGLCIENVKKASVDDADLKKRLEQLLARYDDAVSLYRSS